MTGNVRTTLFTHADTDEAQVTLPKDSLGVLKNRL